jgi:translation initiation factor IF-3
LKVAMPRGSKVRRNGDLRGLPEVNVIGPSGELLGVMTLADALRLAFKQGLDLVEVGPTASPPICKILDSDKRQYAAVKAAVLEKRESWSRQGWDS